MPHVKRVYKRNVHQRKQVSSIFGIVLTKYSYNIELLHYGIQPTQTKELTIKRVCFVAVMHCVNTPPSTSAGHLIGQL